MTSLVDIINSSAFETVIHLFFLGIGVYAGAQLRSVMLILIFFAICLGLLYIMPVGDFEEIAKLFGLAAIGALAVPAVESMMGFR